MILLILTLLSKQRSWGEINEEYGVGSPKEISQDQPHPGVAPPDEEVLILIKFDQTKSI